GLRLPTGCPPAGTHFIAVVIRHHPTGTIADFHCIRLDRSGAWSHKDGKGKVRDVDDTGRPISDLTKARFKWSPALVGIYQADFSKRNLIDCRHASRCTVAGENAGRHTATYSAPSGPGVLYRTHSPGAVTTACPAYTSRIPASCSTRSIPRNTTVISS